MKLTKEKMRYRKRYNLRHKRIQPCVLLRKQEFQRMFSDVVESLLEKGDYVVPQPPKTTPQFKNTNPQSAVEVDPVEQRFSVFIEQLAKAREELEEEQRVNTALQEENEQLTPEHMDVNAVVEECNTLKAEMAKISKENEQIRDKNEKMKKEIHEHMAIIKLHDALKAARKAQSQENKLLKEKEAKLTKEYRKLQATLFQCKVEREEGDRVKTENENLRERVRILTEKIINCTSDYDRYSSLKLPDIILEKENIRLEQKSEKLEVQLQKAAKAQMA